MQCEFKEMLLTKGRGGRPGLKITPKGVVIHWTANTANGADAIANRNYFENHPQYQVSAHYIVDDKRIVRCVPENEMAYHVGAKSYKPEALKRLSLYPNSCTIGIEICVNKDGDFKRTYQNAVSLAADILKRHGLSADDLWRHFDITGKDCPRFFVDDGAAKQFGFESADKGWQKFKDDVAKLLKVEEVVELFKDIKGHWAEKDITRLAELGILRGDEQGNFKPDEPVTRAQLAVVINRLLALLEKK